MKIAAILAVSFFLFSCVPSSYQMNHINLGMTKSDVFNTMGPPNSTSGNDDTEYLIYYLRVTDGSINGRIEPFFVRIKHGLVNSYGRIGDFDSTKPIEAAIDLKVNKDN